VLCVWLGLPVCLQAQRTRQAEAWSAVSGMLKQLWPTAQVHLFGR
jgi:hypothetical protein